MPIIKSAIKRNRQQVKRRSHNLVVKRAVKDDIRVVTDAIAAGDAKAAATAMRAAVSEIDRAVKKGTLHPNTAGRRKSRLSKQIVTAFGTTSTTKKPAAKKPTTAKATAKPAAKKPAAKKASPKTTK